MNISGFRQSKRHRAMPLREAVAWRCENAISCASPQQEIANSRFDAACRSHLSRVIVRLNSKMFMLSGRAITQIPIGHCPL